MNLKLHMFKSASFLLCSHIFPKISVLSGAFTKTQMNLSRDNEVEAKLNFVLEGYHYAEVILDVGKILIDKI